MIKALWTSQIQYYFDLIFILTQKEIKIRYKNSWLGYFWSVANPLAFGLTFFFIFKVVMRFPIPNYALFLIAALFPWQSFANSVSTSTVIFVSNASLIKKVCFPRYFLILSTMLNDTFHFLMSIPVIILFLCYYHMLSPKILLWILFIPLNLLAQWLITFGIAIFLGSINLFFRDLERLVAIVLTLCFYFTPIIYNIESMPEKFRVCLYVNPLALTIQNWRNIWMDYTLDWGLWGLAMCMGLIITVGGSWVYTKLNGKFSEVI